FTLASDFGSRDGSLRLNDDAYGAGSQHKFHDLVVSDIVKESAVVVHNRRDNPGRTVGWRGHHSTARGIFLVDSQRIQVDPFDTAQGIVGVTGTFRDAAFGELLIQFGCPSSHFQTTWQRSFGALDAGLHTVLHDLPDVQDLRTDFFWLAPFNFVLPGQFCNRFALFLAHGQQLGGVAVIVFDFQVRAQWFIELLFGYHESTTDGVRNFRGELLTISAEYRGFHAVGVSR